jgi:transposase
MLQAVKVRLYPTVEQMAFLCGQFGAIRLVWNKALHAMSHLYRVHQKKLSAYHDLKKLLPIAKKFGELKSITIEKTSSGKYFASILFEDGQSFPEKPTQISASKVLGCDMGIAHLLIDSTGEKHDNPKFIKRIARNLRKKNLYREK